MTDHSQTSGEGGPSHWSVEVGVALTTMAFGALILYGSLLVGIGWGIEGPRAGFFPFYISLMIVGASAINLAQVIAGGSSGKLFATWGQLRKVLSVVIPTTIYVAVIPFIGIYISSMVLIAVFMKWLGKYSWWLALLVGIGTPIIFYVLFEKWFLISLPKGPIEDLLNL